MGFSNQFGKYWSLYVNYATNYEVTISGII